MFDLNLILNELIAYIYNVLKLTQIVSKLNANFALSVFVKDYHINLTILLST